MEFGVDKSYLEKFVVKEIFVCLGPKTYWSQTVLGPENLWFLKTSQVLKNVGFRKMFCSKKILGSKKNAGSPQNLWIQEKWLKK